MDFHKIFHEVAVKPYDRARQWKQETSQKIIGYFCSYTPEEIIQAAGALPFRIFGGEVSIARADGHLQAYCCSLAKGGLEEALAGRLGFLDGTVFPHTCDTMQRLSDIWRLNAGFPFHFDVVLPANLNSESSFQYFVDILHKFKRDLARALGLEITDDRLRESIHLYNQIRKSVEEIYLLRSENPAIISGREIYEMMKAAMVMDRAEFLASVSKFLSEVKQEQNATGKSRNKRIILTGGICNHPDIYSVLEECGGAVIWDDLCTGTRYFNGQMDETIDPIEAIAGRYFERMICPTKHRDNACRGENLVKIAKEKQADGVIFLFLKFCDPHAFDYPYLKEYLDREGVPNMLLEVEGQISATGQLRTRVEAFLEML
jgi:bcr-type benzoyl-CoA reductase subunit C